MKREDGWWWFRWREHWHANTDWQVVRVIGETILGYQLCWSLPLAEADGEFRDRIPEPVESAPLTGLERIALTSEQDAAIERGEMVEVRYPDGKL